MKGGNVNRMKDSDRNKRLITRSFRFLPTTSTNVLLLLQPQAFHSH